MKSKLLKNQGLSVESLICFEILCKSKKIPLRKRLLFWWKSKTLHRILYFFYRVQKISRIVLCLSSDFASDVDCHLPIPLSELSYLLSASSCAASYSDVNAVLSACFVLPFTWLTALVHSVLACVFAHMCARLVVYFIQLHVHMCTHS